MHDVPEAAKVRWLKAFSFVAVLLTLVVYTGCGGDDERASLKFAKWGGLSEAEWRKRHQEKEAQQAKEEAARQAEQKKKAAKVAAVKAAEPKKPQPTPAKGPATPVRSDAKPAATTPAEPAVPQLPEDVAVWTERDYYAARLSNDPRLLAAVQQYAGRNVGSEQAVALLGAMLVPLPDPPKTTGAAAQPKGTKTRSPNAKLAETVLTALAANQTAAARQYLHFVLAGTFKVDDDAGATSAVLQALAVNPSKDNDDLLLRVIVSPQQFRPENAVGVNAAALRAKGLSLLGDKTSGGLRAKLARSFVQDGCPPGVREKLFPILMESTPLNFDAQVYLYKNRALAANARTLLESSFAEYSCNVFAHLAKLEPPRQGIDETLLRHLAANLWSSEFTAGLADQLAKVESLKSGAPLILLAATVPNDLVRTALCGTVYKHWEEGAVNLESAGLGKTVFPDPGLIVVIKQVHRRATPARGPTPMTVHGKLGEAAAAQMKIQTMAAERYTNALRTSFALAERIAASEQVRANAPDTPSSIKLPLEVDSPKDVILQYHLDWVSSVRESLPDTPLDPLIVDYLKIEERIRPSKLVAFYRRQMKNAETHEHPRQVWFDGLFPGDEPPRLRSVDVIIRAANPEIPTAEDGERKMIVEILSVEINDPSREAENRTPIKNAMTR